MMTDEPVAVIRESSRNLLKLNRRALRDEQSDINRDLECRVSNEIVAEIGNKLKTKSSITPNDLNVLKNAIIDDYNHIEVILKNHGALRGLVREISGTDVRRQVSAAGCCCNLALGEARACVAIAKAAGSYLVAALANPSVEMAVTCAWTLGNLAGSGPRACELLAAQGAVSALAGLLAGHCADTADAAVYALAHFAYQMKDCLSKEYLDKIIEAYTKIPMSSTASQLLFILSCHDDFIMDSQHLLPKILNYTSVSIDKHIAECEPTNNSVCCDVLYLIRILANSCDVANSAQIMDFFENNIGVQRLKNVLESKTSAVVDSVSWLLGNLYNSYGDRQFYSQMLE